MAFLERTERKKTNKLIVYRYDTKGKPGTVPNKLFDNISGNAIIKK
jgi:hypothetical protein